MRQVAKRYGRNKQPVGTGLVGGEIQVEGGLEMLHRAMRELCMLEEEVEEEYKPSCM